jgi:hypothetical protein
MRFLRLIVAIFLVGSGFGLPDRPIGAMADDNDVSRGRTEAQQHDTSPAEQPSNTTPRAVTCPVVSNAGRRISRRFKFNSNDAAQNADGSLIVHADDVTEPALADGNAAKADRIIELRTDVRLKLQDDSMTAKADRAVITIKYQDKSKATLELITVELSGNVHWLSAEIEASADALTLTFQPSIRATATAARPIDWKLRGRARLKGRNFVAQADQIEVESCNKTGIPKQSALRVTLDGHAALQHTGTSGSGEMHASRMELRPEHGSVPSLSDVLKPLLEGRQKLRD